MNKQSMLTWLLLAGVLFTVEDRQLLAQASQPGAATKTAPQGVKTTASDPLPPVMYGNPFATQAAGTTNGTQGSGSANGAAGVSSDQCSTGDVDPRSIAFVPDPLGMAPGGAPDSLSAPPAEMRPVNPVIKKCEGGRIIMRVETKRFYAYHVGDEIPISILILVDDGVQLKLTSLNQQIIGFQGSDFLMIPVRVVKIASRPYQGRPHSTLYGIQLSVQTFVTKSTLAFNLDLQYAVDVPPGVKQPNWRVLTTPDFVITNTPVITSANDDELEEGDLHPADYRLSWAQWPLMVGGLFMVVWFSFLRRMIVRFNRMRPGRIVPPEEKAWEVFSKVFSDAAAYGEFGTQYLRNIDAALRSYLAQSTKMKIEFLSLKEISALMEDDPRLPTIVSALSKCESVIYARTDQPVTLTEMQIDELHEELKKLVPEPKY